MSLCRFYYWLHTRVDVQIQRVLAFLDQTNLADDTIIVFTSDHGLQSPAFPALLFLLCRRGTHEGSCCPSFTPASCEQTRVCSEPF